MRRILLVDDYTDALYVWAQYLRLSGYAVTACSCGADALAAVERHPPDIAVLDLDLPGMSGFDLARLFRARTSTVRLPLIAMTGHSDPDAVASAKAAGFNLVIIKPCDPERLTTEIDRLLDGAGD
jgi:two-component system cell cycle response regulator DivK